MPSSTSPLEVSTSPESKASAVNWGPIFAGAFAATALTLVLMLLGTGLGLTIVSPWSGESASVTTVAASTAIWMVVMQWLSSALGGYLTGRLRTKWVGVHTDETYFRDTAHGFLAWALATMVVVLVLGSALSSVANTGAKAVAAATAGAATAATGAAANTGGGNSGEVTSYFVDALFRPADASRLGTPGPEGDAAAAAQASRILISSVTAGEITEADKGYLAQLVAARTGLTEADAKARVDTVLAQVNEAKVKAQQAADAARKAGATIALLGALSLMIGAFIASAAAALGGRQRDEDEARFLDRR
ncbi:MULTISPECIES: hypothetical protein [unclassified Chelatococcus]|uniref:hypothetical protein n=1 Tax=unclassified Chelatococcus TaxID=2638111 RepID=UPI001BCBB34C|nr:MULTISPECIES: hypothetical protein [unclassified Chelatococcus]MBS7700059.1 hypothetical protein [Chelatococcus sp. YT9]MBX3556752.1 hypothetical protein [Chelatococcus sp.]